MRRFAEDHNHYELAPAEVSVARSEHQRGSQGVGRMRGRLRRSVRVARCVMWAALIAFLAVPVRAQKPPADLTGKSLEDLMNIEVTSVSKKEEKLFQTAAAVYVITQEDIRRSGLTSIPELLRLVPGLSVARLDGTKWAISARGFNDRFANKLLVLIDGRSVYTSLFSGVYWDEQDLPLENIERIEVIRGPGATVWGANAVNGVINIITKRAEATPGGWVTASGGSEEQGSGVLRYGGKIGDQAHYRVYAKYFNQGRLVDQAGRAAADRWDALRSGFRLDWQASEKDLLTFQGDIYRGDAGETLTTTSLLPPFAITADSRLKTAGGNVLGRWTRTFSARSDLTLQFYYDRTHRNAVSLEEAHDTFDFDFRHRFALGERQDIVWGLGARLTRDALKNNFTIAFTPSQRGDQLWSGFLQDEVTLVKDRLRLILGSKLEHHDDTGWEVQPSARLVWTAHNRQTLWAAVSRAVRTPSRSDSDIRINFLALPGANRTVNLFSIFGDEQMQSETLRAYEFGYRVQPRHNLSLDLTTFYNLYDHLQTKEPATPFFESSPLPPHLVIPLRFSNLMRGETYGAEATANWDVTRRWQLSGSYSFLRMQLHRDAASLDTTSESAEGNSPQHQFQLHSHLTLPRNFELDAALYRVSRLTNQQVPGDTRLDARLGWKVRESVELSVGAQNLLDNRHPEFNNNSGVVASQVTRSFYGKVAWRF